MLIIFFGYFILIKIQNFIVFLCYFFFCSLHFQWIKNIQTLILLSLLWTGATELYGNFTFVSVTIFRNFFLLWRLNVVLHTKIELHIKCSQKYRCLRSKVHQKHGLNLCLSIHTHMTCTNTSNSTFANFNTFKKVI